MTGSVLGFSFKRFAATGLINTEPTIMWGWDDDDSPIGRLYKLHKVSDNQHDCTPEPKITQNVQNPVPEQPLGSKQVSKLHPKLAKKVVRKQICVYINMYICIYVCGVQVYVYIYIYMYMYDVHIHASIHFCVHI